MLVSLLAFALAAAGEPGALSAPSSDVPSQWLSQPTSRDVVDVYPERAWITGRNGKALVTCVAKANGRLADCEVVEETPGDLGFGKAAVRLASKFRIAPINSAQSVEGGRIKYSVAFYKPAER